TSRENLLDRCRRRWHCRSAKEPFSSNHSEAWELRVARRELRVREVGETYLHRIEAVNPKLDAFVAVPAEQARWPMPHGSIPPSLAVPLFDLLLASFCPRADAEIVVRLRRASAHSAKRYRRSEHLDGHQIFFCSPLEAFGEHCAIYRRNLRVVSVLA